MSPPNFKVLCFLGHMVLIYFLLTPPSRRVTEHVEMATQSRAMQQFALLDKPAWSGDDRSKFEPVLPSDSPTLSLGYESAFSEELNLYDSRCIQYLVAH